MAVITPGYWQRCRANQDQLRPGLDPEDAANGLWLLTSFDTFDLLRAGRLLALQRVADTLTAMAEHAATLCL
jgi:hypothetical protein